MALPGYSVIIGERPANTAFPSNTATGIMVGFSERGSTESVIEILSPADAQAKLGNRIATSPTHYDSIEAFFREGGGRLLFSRIDPGSALAAKELVDTESKKDLKVVAKSKGSWGNNIKVAVTNASSKFKLEVKYENVVVEVSPEFSAEEEAITWAATYSAYINIINEAESAAIPKTQEITLAGGTYAPGSVTGTQKKEAIERINKDLGPGQIALPGETSEEIHKALLEHAAANNRRAILDDVDTATYAEIASHATILRGTSAKFGTMVAPYAKIPGLTIGTTRTIPYSAIYMAQIARSQAEGNNPNVAAAGRKRGACLWATELTQTYTNAGLKALNEAGVIAAKYVRGVPTTFGNVTLVNQTTEPNWKSFSASRLIMGVAALASEVCETFEFEQIDAHGHTFSAFQTALSNIACMPYYNADALYGNSPPEAFEVNIGPDVNTPASIAAEELKAQISLRVSPTGEVITVEVVKVPITEGLV